MSDPLYIRLKKEIFDYFAEYEQIEGVDWCQCPIRITLQYFIDFMEDIERVKDHPDWDNYTSAHLRNHGILWEDKS